MLFHISEESDIRQFTPRTAPSDADSVVWAIDAHHLRNYLLPRDCPRVTYSAVATTTDADRARFLAEDHRAVVAIESRWIDRVQSARLFCYHLPRDTFELLDASAGYFVSRESVTPEAVELIADVESRLRAQRVDLRVLPNLWALHDAVVASSLEFSMIRMLNAQPRC